MIFLDEVAGDIRRLDDVNRFSSIPVVYKENVATHSYWVTVYALLIHESIHGDPNLSYHVLVKALTHDMIECMSGDFVKTFKYMNERLKIEIDKTEEIAKQRLPDIIQSMMSIGNYLSKVENDYVEMIVKAADVVSLYIYMQRERRRGNRDMEPFYEIMKKDIMKFRDKVAEWEISGLAELYDVMIDYDVVPSYGRVT